jgi:hypothetical protein
VLVDRITPEILQEIRGRLDSVRLARHVILRSGDVRQVDHLARVNYRQARAIIVPGADQRPDEALDRDATTAKVVASLASDTLTGEMPTAHLAVEIASPSIAPILAASYPGKAHVIPTDVIVGRSIAQGIVSPGLSSLFADIMDPREGGAALSRQYPELAGTTTREAAPRFRAAVILGVRRAVEADRGQRWLSADETVEAEDDWVLLVPHGEQPKSGGVPAHRRTAPVPDSWDVRPARRRIHVLILGWSDKVPQLLDELSLHKSLQSTVDIVARRDVSFRERSLSRVAPRFPIEIRHFVSDTTSPDALAQHDLGQYTSIVLLASDAHESPEAADTQTIAARLILEHQLAAGGRRAHLLVELLDPANAALFGRSDAEIVQTPAFMADTLAGMVTEPELTPLLGEVISAGMTVEVVALDDLAEVTPELDLYRLDERLRREGLALIGLQRSETGFELELAPDKEQILRIGPGDRAIVFNPGLG